MPSARPSSERQRGEIETLASGSLRVKVYAGIDPLSGKRHYLTETVPAGPRALAEAKKVRTRLIGQIDEQRNPRTRATVDQLMDRYLEVLDVEVTTRARYEVTIRRHVRPLLGHLPVAKLTGETIDTFNGVLRRCREHCDGRPFIEHGGGALRPGEVHDCTAKCRPHTCKPLSAASIRKIHFCLSGALTRAVRWHWITVNPLDAAEARELINRTKAGVKLKGYRGKPALHEASTVKALVGLSNLMADAGSRIASIDINPFLINTKTGVAVDALIVLNNAAAKSAASH